MKQQCQFFQISIPRIYIFSSALNIENLMKDKNYSHYHKIYQFQMEAYKKQVAQNEAQIISHIKSIARELFDDEPSEMYYNRLKNVKDEEQESSKKFVRTAKKPEGKYDQYSFSPNAQSRVYLSPTLPNSRSKSKKTSIFGNFDEFWSKCKESPPKKVITPIMDRINKNIYSRFKTTNKTSADLHQNILNSSERQQHWNDFLRRQQEWEREKNRSIRQSQMERIAKQSPSLKKRVSTVVNLNHYDKKAQRQMTDVQISLKRLKLQTQKLRLKILKIDDGQNAQEGKDRKKKRQK